MIPNYPNYYNQIPQYFAPQAQNFSQQAQNNGQQIQYVNGFESAKAFQLSANSSVLLMDSTMARFYVKQTDASGFPTIKAYDFTEATENVASPSYVTKEEFEQFKNELLKGKKKGGALNESPSE